MTFALVLVALFAVLSLPPFRRLELLARPRERAALAAAGFFVLGGALHFVMPEMYDRMIPPFLPGSARGWTLLSGAFEILGGLGLAWPRTRRLAGLGVVLLLFAILPANVHVATSAAELPELPYPRWYFWVRIPFQLFYVAWVLWAAGLFAAIRRWRGGASRLRPDVGAAGVGRRASREAGEPRMLGVPAKGSHPAGRAGSIRRADTVVIIDENGGSIVEPTSVWLPARAPVIRRPRTTNGTASATSGGARALTG